MPLPYLLLTVSLNTRKKQFGNIVLGGISCCRMRPGVSRDAVNFGFYKTRESLEQVEDYGRLSTLLHGVT